MAVKLRDAVRSTVGTSRAKDAGAASARRPLVSRDVAKRLLAAAVAVGLAGSSVPVRAADLYWDMSPATDGSGGPTPSGAWNGSFWSTDAGGSAGVTPGAWVAGSNAFFSAGTDATGAYTVNPTATQSVTNITAQEGTVTLGTGGSLSLAANAVWGADTGATLLVSSPVALNAFGLTVNTTGNTTISGVVSGTGALTKTGSGTLFLTGVNTFTGAVINITGGTLSAPVTQLNNNDVNSPVGGVGARNITINGGTFQQTGTTLFNPTAAGLKVFTIGASGGTIDIADIAGGITLDDAGQFVGNGAFTKTGLGRLILGNGTTAFVATAAININGGSLRLNGSGANALGAATLVSVGDGAELDLNGLTAARPLSLTGGGMTGGGTGVHGALTNVSGTAGTVSSTVAIPTAASVGGTGTGGITISGVVSGAGVLTKVDANTLTLSAANLYAGGTIVNGGTVLTNNTTALGTGAVTVNTGATLTLTANTALTVPTAAGAIALNGGTLTSTASATTAGTITNAVTTSGNAILAPGGFANIGSLRIGTLTTAANTALNFDFNTAAGTNDLLTVTGNGTFSAGSGTLLTFANAPAAAGNYKLIGYTGTAPTLGNFTLPAAPNSRTTYGLSTGVDAGFVDLVVTTGATIATVWQGTGAGPNNWNDAANWTNGIPGIAGDTATFANSTGATNQVVNLNEQQHVGTLVLNNATTPTPGTYTLAAGTAGGLFLDNGAGTAALNNVVGSNTISAPFTLSSNSTVTVSNLTDTLTVSGVIGNTGFGTLTKGGDGTLLLSGANTFSGAATVNAGTIKLGNGAALGTTAGNTAVNAGGTVDLNGQTSAEPMTLAGTGETGTGALINTGGAATLSGGVTLTGATTVGSIGTGATTLSGAVGLGANTLTVDGGQATTLSGVISGAGGLVKQGAGTLTLSNTGNSFTGPINVNAGTLAVSGTNNAGTGGKAVTISNGSTFSVTGNFDPGSGTVGLFTGTGGAIFNVNSGVTLTLNDANQFGGSADLTKAGVGTLILGQTGTLPTYNFTGGINLTAGTIQVLNTAAFGTPSNVAVTALATLNLQGIATATPLTLNGSGTAATVGALTNGGAAGVVSTVSGAVTLGSAVSVGGAGDLVLSGGVGGSGPLTKINAGNLTLSGPSTYTGGTVLSAGTLTLNNTTGSATGTGNVTLNAGTLTSGPTASIAGNVLAGSAAHVISPGGVSNVGTLTLGGLTTSSLTTLTLDLIGPGTGNDLLVVNGANAFTVGANTLLSFTAKPTTAGIYRLFDYNEAGAAPTIGNFVLPGVPNARTHYALATDAEAGGYVDLVVTVDPGAGGTTNTAAVWIPAGSAGSRTWNADANWNPNQIPTVAGDTASFTTSSNVNETVTLDVEHHVAALTFSNPGTGVYTIATSTSGAGSLVLDNGGDTATVTNTNNNNVVSAPVALASNTTAVVTPGKTLTLSGAVTGPRPLSVNGGGTLALSGGGNAFTGGLTVSGGSTVIFAANTAGTADNLGSAASNVVLDGGTLQFTPTGSITLGTSKTLTIGAAGGTLNLPGVGTAGKIAMNASQLTGSGTFTKTGGGDLQIQGNPAVGTAPSPFTGTFNVNGLVELSINGGLGSGTVVLNSPGELAIANTVTVANAVTINGGTLTGQGAAGANVSGPVTANGAFSVAPRNFNTPTTQTGFTISGPISGTGDLGFTPSTNGTANRVTVLLSGNNANWSGNINTSGATLVDGITLRLGSTTALGNTTGSTTIANGGQLDLNGVTLSTAEPLFVGGTGPTNFPTTLTNELASTPATFSGPITLTSNTTIGSNSGGTFTLSGPIGGAFNLTKIGTSQTTILSGTNSYANTVVTTGTLQVGAGGTSGTLGTGPVTVATGLTLAFNRTDDFVIPNQITTTTTGLVNQAGTGRVTLSSASNTLGAITWTNTGPIDLGANVTTVGNGGGNSIQNLSGGDVALDATGGGAINLFSAASDIGSNPGRTLTINAPIQGAAGFGIDLYNGTGAGGTVVLKGASTFNGPVSVQQTNLTVDTINSVATNATTGAVHAATSNLGSPTSAANGTISLAVNNATTFKYTGPGEVTDRVVNLGGTTSTATIDQSGTGPLTFVTNFTAGGAGSKTLALTGSVVSAAYINGLIVNNSGTNTTAVAKTGTGTWVLGGANTYSGGTTVSAGTLLVNNATGSGTGTGAVTVSGGTLGGGGIISGAVTIASGGTLAPGNSPGILTVAGNVALNAGSNYAIEIGGNGAPGLATGYDQLVASGAASTVTLAGGLSVSLLNGYTPTSSDVFYVVSKAGTGAVTGTFAGLPAGTPVALGNGLTGTVSYSANWTGDPLTSSTTGGNDVAIYNVVPEPASAGLLGMAAFGLLARRRRRAGR